MQRRLNKMAEDRKAKYKAMAEDPWPDSMEMIFGGQRLIYEKVTWKIGETIKGLRYGDNPGMPSALYRLVNGNLAFGDVQTIKPGKYLVSDAELLQSGKHPGKTNLTDVDNALNILRWLDPGESAAVIVKHGNPCGVAAGSDLADAYRKADLADRIAAFGGGIALNQPMDMDTARAIADNYAEIVAAPEFEEGTMGILEKRKNLRVMRVRGMEDLIEYRNWRVPEFKSLIDGGLVVQLSQEIQTRSTADFVPASTVYKGDNYVSEVTATQAQLEDVLFALQVEIGVMSNSVLFVKDKATVAIGAGGQDRVGIVVQAAEKAYRNTAETIAWTRFGKKVDELQHNQARRIQEEVAAMQGGLAGSASYSDAFYPFRDGVDAGLDKGVAIVGQPGGSDKDYEAIQACNEAKKPMVFTKSGERLFKH